MKSNYDSRQDRDFREKVERSFFLKQTPLCVDGCDDDDDDDDDDGA